MNDIQIKHFIALAKIGSFTKAEETLNITKTALKKQIDTLEAELQFQVFIRTPKGLYLTEPGQHFLTEVNRLYLDFTTLVHECQELSLHRKKIKIGIYSMSNMLNWYTAINELSDFEIEYIYLSGENLTHENNFQLLQDRKIDFLEYEDNQMVYEKQLLFKRTETDYLCCIMRPNHPLAQNDFLHPRDLLRHEIYCWTSDSSATRALYDQARALGLHLHAVPYSKNAVLNICHFGDIYILSHTLASSFRPLKVIPIIPKISYYRGLVCLPENESLLSELLSVADPSRYVVQAE